MTDTPHIDNTPPQPQLTSQIEDWRDEDGHIALSVVTKIRNFLLNNQADDLKAFVDDIHEADMADVVEALDADERPHFVQLLGRAFDFNILNEVDDTVREEILEELPNEVIAEGVSELESDDAVTILEGMEEEDQDEVLARLPDSERISLERSLDYPEYSAGRRMQTDVISIPSHWSVGHTIDYMRDTADLPDQFYELFVVDPTHKLVGTVPLNRVLRAQRRTPIEALQDEVMHPVSVAEDLEEIAHMFKRYNLVSTPVIDEHARLVGVLMVDDVLDVIDDEADADIKALGGVSEDEELSDSVWYIAKSRFGWLFINLLTAFLASSVVGLFQAELSKMVALAVLLPIVASQGGNAGTQTMTVAVRALATKELTSLNAGRVVVREILVGLLNGFGFAILTGLAAGLWFASIGLGLVIGTAMVINLLAAACAGILIPIILDKLDYDPAVSSGVFVTTVTDVIGFFAFLGVAALWLR